MAEVKLEWRKAVDIICTGLGHIRDEWLFLSDNLGITWDDLQNDNSNSSDILFTTLDVFHKKHKNSFEKKVKLLRNAFTQMNRTDLIHFMDGFIMTHDDKRLQEFTSLKVLGSKLKVGWLAIIQHLKLDIEDYSEPTQPSLINHVSMVMKRWLLLGIVDPDTKVVQLRECIQMYKLEHLLRYIPQPVNILPEDPLVYHYQRGEYNTLNGRVIVKISAPDLTRKKLLVFKGQLSEHPLPAEEAAASDILVLIPKDRKGIKNLSWIAIPYVVPAKDHGLEACVYQWDEKVKAWKDQPNFDERGFRVVENLKISRTTILVVASRLIKEKIEVGEDGGKIDSEVDTAVGVTFPPRAYSGKKQNIEMQVLPTEVHKEKISTLTNAEISSVVHINSSAKPKKPVGVQVAMRSMGAEPSPRGTGQFMVVAQGMNEEWRIVDITDGQAKDGKASFKVDLAEQSSRLMVIGETTKFMSPQQAAKLASEIVKKIHEQHAYVIVKQHRKNPRNLSVVCCGKERKDEAVAAMDSAGYDYACDYDCISKCFTIMEGSMLEFTFNDGQIQISGRNKSRKMAFSRHTDSAKQTVHVEPIADECKDGDTDIWGNLQVVDSSKEVCCDLAVTLPLSAKNTSHTMFFRQDSMIMRQMQEELLTVTLDLKDFPSVLRGWKNLARRLGVSAGEITELERSSREGATLGDTLHKMIDTWTQQKGKEATAEELIKALKDERMNDAVVFLEEWYKYKGNQ